jgi:hypothetical protein
LPELAKRLEEILYRKFPNKVLLSHNFHLLQGFVGIVEIKYISGEQNILLFHRHFVFFVLVLFEQNDYYNMMNGPVEPQLQLAIKTLSAQSQHNQQNPQMRRQIASSSGYGTMIPTPGMTQGTSASSRIPYVTDNNALSSSGGGMVPQNANMGASMQGAYIFTSPFGLFSVS